VSARLGQQSVTATTVATGATQIVLRKL